MSQRTDALLLAKYYVWLNSTFDYYHCPPPCRFSEAKEAAQRIIKREVEKQCKTK